MSQPVKLSDALVLDARLAGRVMERSIAGQVEFWARLGRAIEPLLRSEQAFALCQRAAARPLSDCLREVDSDRGRQRVAEELYAQPFPHYEHDPAHQGLIVRVDADGTRTSGRFIKRVFTPTDAAR